MLLAAPALDALRIASPADILRIGIVAACGFRYTTVFNWERPYHHAYPADTLLSYRQQFSDAIKDTKYIVLVAVDKYDPNEGGKSDAVIPPDNGAKTPAPGDEVIVGVACWKLEPGSDRLLTHLTLKRLTNILDGSYPTIPANLHRDEDSDRVKRCSHLATAAEHKYDKLTHSPPAIFSPNVLFRYFEDMATMEMVVVHPAYWRRGHGTTLVKWGMKLAKLDQVRQGVVAATMGAKLYMQLGYKQLNELHLDGDELATDGITVAVMEFDPMKLQGQELQLTET